MRLDSDVYERLKRDRDHFQAVIGGGRWSISDAIRERSKILDGLEK